jgi:hypothetical protein
VSLALRVLLVVACVLMAGIGGAVDYRDVPVGNARDSEITSRTIDELITRCAARYRDCDAMIASGRYIEASKQGTSETQQAAKMRMIYRAPDLLRIESDNKELSALFLADGTTVTFAWPEDRKYVQFAQPADLAAFSDEERAGDVLRDETGAMMQSIAAPLLTTSDTEAWIHANVDEYFFDGVDDDESTPLVRIRFLQSDPDSIVQLWLDPDTAWIRKLAMLQARDEEGELVQSYAEAQYARMNLSIIDDLSTDPAAITDDMFAFTVPGDWEPADNAEEESDGHTGETLWRGMFRAAAAQQGDITTLTLESDDPSTPVQIGWLAPFRHGVISLAAVPPAAGREPLVAAANERNRVGLLDRNGSVTATLRPLADPDYLAAVTSDSTTLLVCGDVDGTVSAHTLNGALVWKHERRAMLQGVASAGGRVYSAYSDNVYPANNGALLTFTPDGRLVAGTRKPGDVYSVFAGPIGEGETAVVGQVRYADLAVFTAEGRLAADLEFDEMVLQAAFDEVSSTAPLIAVGSTGLEDLFLRRLNLAGAQQWSRSLAQFAKDEKVVYPAGLAIVRLAPRQRLIAAVLGDGRLFLSDMEGQPVWRGKISVPPRFVVADPEDLFTGLVVNDLDGDGAEELYLGTRIGVVQVKARE